MKTVGLDVHWKTSTYCILDEHGLKIKTRTVRGGWSKLLEALLEEPALEEPWTICFESSCGYGALYDKLSTMASRITVAHPGQVRLIFQSKRKNDRVDAEKLAKLQHLDEVPTVHVPSAPIRDWRKMIEFRCRQVQKRAAVKCSIRSLLRGYGIEMPRSLWTKKGRTWLEEQDMPSEEVALQRDILMETLVHLDQLVQRVTRHLDRLASKHPGVALLKTVPGIGTRTAEAIMAYIDKPKRFSRNRSIGAYFGLVPSQDASAQRNRLGHITKQGPSTVRRYLTEATWKGILKDSTIRAHFERLTHGKPERRKIALVGTAHWLLRCMLAMLQKNESWRIAS